MTVNELYQSFIDGAARVQDFTCDGIIVGDGNREVGKIATCFNAAAGVIEKAVKNGVSLLICHEPVFTCGDYCPGAAAGFDLKKLKMIEEGGLTLVRLHDYAHLAQPDFIHAGFIKTMGLEVTEQLPEYQMGIRTYVLKNPLTPLEIAKLTEEKLGSRYTRIVGNREKPVRSICLALGSIGLDQVRYLDRDDCDMIITGEAGEVIDCRYVCDMNYFGVAKSMILMGHYTAEYCGMAEMAEYLRERGFDAEYPLSYL